MSETNELLRLLIRGLRDKAALTAADWERIREIEEGLR